MDFNNCSNNSESVGEFLRFLEEKSNRTMIPAVVMLVVFALVGLVGNILVLVVYSQKVRLNPTKVLIMTIASFDLVANVGAIPSEINIMLDAWSFNQPGVCKLKVFLGAFTTLGAAISLCIVAVVRYRKVCRHYSWQVTIRQAKVSSLITFITAIIIAIPYTLIYGIRTRNTPCANIKGSECFADDHYFNTIWPLMNNLLFIIIFISLSSSFVVLYSLIARTAWQHREQHGISPEVSKGKDKCKSSPRLPARDARRKDSQNGISQNHVSFIQPLSNIHLGRQWKLSLLTCCSRRREIQEEEHGSQASIIINTYSSTLSNDDEDNSCEVTRSEKLSSESSSKATSSKTVSPETSSSETSSLEATSSESMEVAAITKMNFFLNPLLHHPEHTNLTTSEHPNKQDTPETEKSSNKHNKHQNPAETLRKDDFSIENRSNEDKTTISDKNTLQKPFADKQRESGTTKALTRRPLGRMTIMLIIITMIYVFGYFPFLVLTVIRNKLPLKYASLNQVELVFYNLFYRLYFLNSAANAIVYSFCDLNFRRHCLQLLTCKYKRML